MYYHSLYYVAPKIRNEKRSRLKNKYSILIEVFIFSFCIPMNHLTHPIL